MAEVLWYAPQADGPLGMISTEKPGDSMSEEQQ